MDGVSQAQLVAMIVLAVGLVVIAAILRKLFRK
jgi:hypothetical protein